MKNKIFYLLFIICFKSIYSQELKVDKLTEEQEVNEEMSSVDESITIPIYTINIGNISYPINLRYSFNGIGVDDTASDVGLGWELTNSFIHREIKDKTDVDNTEGGIFPRYSATGYENQNNTYYYPNYIFFKKRGYQKSKADNIIEHYNTNIGYQDREPDIFNISTPYFSTAFYFPVSLTSAQELYHKNTNIGVEINNFTTVDYTTYRAVHNNNTIGWNRIFSEYKKFSITQNNGIISTFDQPDFVHNANFIKLKMNGQLVYSYNTYIANNIPFVEKWHLSKIEDPITSREINFTYETYTTEDDHVIEINRYKNNNKPYYREGVSYKYNYNFSTHSFITNDCYIYHDPGEENEIEYGRLYKRYLKKKRIKTISFDNGSVEFIYGLNRADFHNGKALTRIEIRNKENKLINSFDLEYDYFESPQYRNEFSKRLKLLSITSLDNAKYSFSYYEDNKMPQIGSLNKDFYGYCNTANDDLVNINDEATVNYPIYYYYPDKYEYSVMPYNISGQQKFLLEGNINKEPNDLAKTWSLKKINYPTSGYTEYILENNIFNLWNNNLKGPGIRIASKTSKTSNSDANPKTIYYNYNLTDGSSSGKIYNFPLAGYPVKQLFTSYEDDYGNLVSHASSYNGETNLYKSFLLYQALSKGAASVKYSMISKSEGLKKMLFKFDTQFAKNNRFARTFFPNNGINDFTQGCISEFAKTNSGLGFDSNAHIIVSPLSIEYFEGNNLLKKVENKYKNFLNKEDLTTYSPQNNEFKNLTIRNSKSNFNGHIIYKYENILTYDRNLHDRNNYLVETNVTEYFPSGNLSKKIKYDYSSLFSFRNPVLVSKEIIDNMNNSSKNTFHYPYSSGLTNANILQPIGGATYFNNNQISKTTQVFENAPFLPSAIHSENSSNSRSKEVMSSAIYDSKGNLISFKNSEGIPTTILYGYNQTLPIAIMEGVDYYNLAQDLQFQSADPDLYLNLEIVKKSNQDIDVNTEQAFYNELETFRKLLLDRNDYRITTYTYDTLIGITSKTSPTGMKEKYIYNTTTNKLERIEDRDGNIIQEFKYNFKN